MGGPFPSIVVATSKATPITTREIIPYFEKPQFIEEVKQPMRKENQAKAFTVERAQAHMKENMRKQ